MGSLGVPAPQAQELPLPCAELGRGGTSEPKPPHVIAFEYLPEGWDQASPGCAGNGATILSKPSPRRSEGLRYGLDRKGLVEFN